MKKILPLLVLCSAVSLPSCSIFKTVVKHPAIDAVLANCVAENAWMDEPKLREACEFAEDLLPIVRDMVSAYRKGLPKAAAKCGGG